MKKLFFLFVSLSVIFIAIHGKTEKKIEYYKNGKQKAEGELKDGKKQGIWVGWYESGERRYEGEF